MTKLTDRAGYSKPQAGEFRSARAAVWRQLTTVRNSATGHFKESLVKQKAASKDPITSSDKKK